MQHPVKGNNPTQNVEATSALRSDTVSETVLASLQDLVDRANMVRGLTHDRLHPFTYPRTEGGPEESTPGKEPPQISYPPFYAMVRNACGEISEALAEVERMLNAAEL